MIMEEIKEASWSLPDDIHAYVEEILELLAKHSWIYDFQLTKFFLDKVWENIPEEWNAALYIMTFDGLNGIPYGILQPDWPVSLKSFITQAVRLGSLRAKLPTLAGTEVPQGLRRGMNPKKQHEVSCMAAAVNTVCQQTGCKAVVDVGSGLGYLGHVLANMYGCHVVGLESEDMRVHSADARIQAIQDSGPGRMKSMKMRLADDDKTLESFSSLLHDPFFTQNKDQAKDKEVSSMCKRTGRESFSLNSAYSKSQEGLPILSNSTAMHKFASSAVATHKALGPKAAVVLRTTQGCSDGACIVAADRTKDLRTAGDSKDDRCLSETGGLNPSSQECRNTVESTETVMIASQGLTHSQSRITEIKERGTDFNTEQVSTVDDWLKRNTDDTYLKTEQLETAAGEKQGQQQTMIENLRTKKSLATTGAHQVECVAVKVGHNIRQHSETTCDHMSALNEQQKTETSKSCDELTTVQHKLPSFNCSKEAEQEMGVCLVGLHACGDLTPVILQLYHQVAGVHGLVLISCCYHRMAITDGKFKEFPLSECIRSKLSVVQEKYQDWALGTCAFRLAAQETRSRWKDQSEEDHEDHVRHVTYRGLLEVVMATGIEMEKSKRKTALPKDYETFDKYCEAISQRVKFKGTSSCEVKVRLQKAHKEFEPFISYVEPITVSIKKALQVLLQPVLETLIILDRVLYLRELGHQAFAVPLFDENLSPRNIAIIACKGGQT